MASTDLLWECVKGNNSFIKKQKNMPVLSSEKNNLTGLHSKKYSGIANRKCLGLNPVTSGKKESIVLTRSTPLDEKMWLPEKVTNNTGLNKFSKKGLASLEKLLAGVLYRKDLLSIAKDKYLKIKKSFKKKKTPVHSRREKK